MSLSCAIALSTTSYAAGSTPPPMASVVCVNGTGSALVVTSVQLYYRVDGSTTPGNPIPFGAALPPYGPGAPVTVPASSTLTIGPFPVVVGSAAAANLGAGGSPPSQPSQVRHYRLMIGAYVTASDSSVNQAAELGLTVAPSIAPTLLQGGGQFIYSQPNNSANWFFF